MLTEKQAEMLQHIQSYIAANGIPPTVREIQSMTGHKSPSTVAAMLKLIEEKGYIRHDPKTCRSIRVVKRP